MDHAEFWGIVGDLSLQPLTDAQVSALENLIVVREAQTNGLTTKEVLRLCELGLAQSIGFGFTTCTIVATRRLLSFHAAGRLPELLRAGRPQCA